MQIIVQEMLENSDMGTGAHAWIDIQFDDGKVVTLRLDERDIHVKRPRLYARVNDNIGKDMIL